MKNIKKSSMRTYILSSILFIVLFITIWQSYLFIFPHSRVSFPTFKPDGYTIKHPEVVMYAADIVPGVHNILTPEVSLRYDLTEGGGLSVFQETGPVAMPDCNHNLSTTCSIRISPKGQEYIFTTDVNPFARDAKNRYMTDQGVIIVKSNTYISVSSQNNLDWDKGQWDKLIDSFHPARFPEATSRWETPGP